MPIIDSTLTTHLIDPAADTAASDTVTFGPIHLDVTDGERALPFWRDLIGLTPLPGADGSLVLGAGDEPLVILHPGATAPVDRHATGLYHLALHLPTLADFTGAIVRLAAAGYPQYPTDHIMHLANYVDDADGNGLELVFETPDRFQRADFTAANPAVIDAAGRRRGPTEAIDPDWLQAQLATASPARRLPAGTHLGHVHLRVADIDATLAFYRDLIGLTTNMHIPGFGMFDMSAGGRFPHRLAGNVWESGGRPQPAPGTAGLHEFTIRQRDPAALAATVDRLQAAGHPVTRDPAGAMVRDPAGNRLHLTGPA